MPACTPLLGYAAAFACVSLLFSSHLMGRDVVDVAVHTILYHECLVLAVVCVVESFLPQNTVAALLRCVLLLLLGTWFVQVGTILYGNGHAAAWDARDMHLTMLAAVVFAMHVGVAVLSVTAAVAVGYVLQRFVGLLEPPRWTAACHLSDQSTDLELLPI